MRKGVGIDIQAMYGMVPSNFPAVVAPMIVEDVCSLTADITGSLECFNDDSLAALANKAEQLYGNAHNISVASIASLGTVIGQFIHT